MGKTNELIQRFLGEPVKNIMHSMYDDYVEANVKLRSRSGVKSFIIRRELSKCCKWCHDLAGIYEASNAPGNIYQRHDNCRCMVTFRNEKGQYVDVWTKEEYTTQRQARRNRQNEIIKEQAQFLSTSRALLPYYEKATPGVGPITKEQGYKKKEDIDANNYGYIIHKIFGGSLTFQNRSNDKRKSDYLWNGKCWEHKHVSSFSSADSQTHSCLGQIKDKPGGVIIQLSPKAYNLSRVKLEEVIRHRLDRSAANYGITSMDVIVFQGEKIILAFSWSK